MYINILNQYVQKAHFFYIFDLSPFFLTPQNYYIEVVLPNKHIFIDIPCNVFPKSMMNAAKRAN